MSNITDELLSEAHGWRSDRPRLSQAEAKPPESFLKRLRRLGTKRVEQGFRHTLESWDLMQWGAAAAGEMGEALNVCKKVKRAEMSMPGGIPLEKAREALGDEIADTIIYLDLLAARAGIDLEEAIGRKFDIVSQRVGFDERLGDDHADRSHGGEI